MAESLTNFISGFKNPAKTNMYKLVFRGENGAVVPSGLDIRAKGAQLPTAEMGIMEIPYKGRKVKIPAERSFSEWTVTVMETNDMNVRRSFEKWMSVMDAEDEIKRNTAALSTIDVILLICVFIDTDKKEIKWLSRTQKVFQRLHQPLRKEWLIPIFSR